MQPVGKYGEHQAEGCCEGRFLDAGISPPLWERHSRASDLTHFSLKGTFQNEAGARWRRGLGQGLQLFLPLPSTTFLGDSGSQVSPAALSLICPMGHGPTFQGSCEDLGEENSSVLLVTREERPGASRLQLSGLCDSIYTSQTKQEYLNDPAHFSHFVRFNDFNFTTLQPSVMRKGASGHLDPVSTVTHL